MGDDRPTREKMANFVFFGSFPLVVFVSRKGDGRTVSSKSVHHSKLSGPQKGTVEKPM